MVNPILEFGPLSIRFYSVFLLAAVAIPYLLVRRSASRFKDIPAHVIDDLALILIPLGIIGARLYHVLDKWGYYRLHLLEIFYLWQGGLGIFGALLFGLLVLLYFCRVKRLHVFQILDLLAPFVLLGQALGRVGNFFNQEGFGPPTLLPWGVYIDPKNRPSIYQHQAYFHPTFFYEALWDLVGFVLLLWLSGKRLPRGIITCYYLIIYGLGRLGVEYFRIDTFTIGNIKLGFLISSLIMLAGLFLLLRLTRMKNTYDS